MSSPSRALEDPYPGSKACMSDEQLRDLLVYLALSYFPRYLDACHWIDYRLEVGLEQAWIAFETRSYPLVENLIPKINESLRPAYGDQANEVRVAMRKTAADREYEMALKQYDSDACKNLIRNLIALSREITPEGPGQQIANSVEMGMLAERKYIPRCPK